LGLFNRIPSDLGAWKFGNEDACDFREAGLGGFFKNQRDATAAGFDEVDSELGRCIVVHDAGLRGKPRLHGIVGPKRQQAVVEYLTVAGLGSLTQKRLVDKVVHGGSLFWQREEKGFCDLCGDPEPLR